MYKIIQIGGGVGRKDLTERVSPCLKCNTVLSKPEDKGIFYRCLCVVFENRSPYET